VGWVCDFATCLDRNPDLDGPRYSGTHRRGCGSRFCSPAPWPGGAGRCDAAAPQPLLSAATACARHPIGRHLTEDLAVEGQQRPRRPLISAMERKRASWAWPLRTEAITAMKLRALWRFPPDAAFSITRQGTRCSRLGLCRVR
jgi:hypothetical protein